VGKDLQQLDFSQTQGKGETRIAAASGIHPAVLGLSEGLQGASLNAGNFGAARRLTADKTLRPLWREACAALESIVDPPMPPSLRPGEIPTPVRLWIDEQDIPFLREDMKDRADAGLVRAQTIEAFVRSGFTPDSSAAAVDAEDLTLLVHSGLVSVQLQPPGASSATDTGVALPSTPGGTGGALSLPTSGPASESAKTVQDRLNATP
jgi:hypothetical protein